MPISIRKQIETTFTKNECCHRGAIDRHLHQVPRSRLGPVGSVLSAIGPTGLAVAASIGVLAGAFEFLSTKVDQFAEGRRALREFSESTGLSVNAIKALGDAGLKVGLDFEQTERFVTRLAVAVQQLRTNGSGPLFDVLVKLRPELASQVAGAKDLASAIDILSAAFKELNSLNNLNFQRPNSRPTKYFWRPVAWAALPAGGVGQLTEEAKTAGKAMDEELIAKISQLRIEIEAIKKPD